MSSCSCRPFRFSCTRLTISFDRYLINYEYSKDLNINSMGRRIRTRLYFTSESHLHTVLNVFRFAQIGNAKRSLLSHHGKSILNSTPELCYLTQVVMRVFEDNRRPMDDPRRFRMEIHFSPGATATPMHMNELDREQDQSRFDTAPLQLIGREGLTCQEVEKFFEQAIMAGRSDEEGYEMASTSTAAENRRTPKKKGKKKDANTKTENLASEVANPVPTPVPSRMISDEIASAPQAVSNETVSAPPAIVETNSPSTVGDLSIAPDLPSLEPPILETSEPIETTDGSAVVVHPADAQDTVRVKNDAHNRERGTLNDLFPASIEVSAENREAKENDGGGAKSNGRPADEPSSAATRNVVIPEKEIDERKGPIKPFSRKYFWGTVAVASFGVGITCIAMALTMTTGERRSRRWTQRSY